MWPDPPNNHDDWRSRYDEDPEWDSHTIQLGGDPVPPTPGVQASYDDLSQGLYNGPYEQPSVVPAFSYLGGVTSPFGIAPHWGPGNSLSYPKSVSDAIARRHDEDPVFNQESSLENFKATYLFHNQADLDLVNSYIQLDAYKDDSFAGSAGYALLKAKTLFLPKYQMPAGLTPNPANTPYGVISPEDQDWLNDSGPTAPKQPKPDSYFRKNLRGRQVFPESPVDSPLAATPRRPHPPKNVWQANTVMEDEQRQAVLNQRKKFLRERKRHKKNMPYVLESPTDLDEWDQALDDNYKTKFGQRFRK
jgi:hypothetical protein